MNLDPLLARAAASPARLLLTGADPDRLACAATRLRAAGLTTVSVIGPGGLLPESQPLLPRVAELLRARAPGRVRDAIHALDLAAEPLRFALGLASLDEADAVVCGSALEIGALVDATEWMLGPPEAETRSASWLLLEDGRMVALADCALPAALDPTTQDRLRHAVAGRHLRLAAKPPKVSVLTSGSQPAPGTRRFRGEENVFIFSGGTAAGLALDMVQSLAGALRLGPLLIGSWRAQVGLAATEDEDELVGTAAATVLAAGVAGT